jgi:hypothetical protein
MGESKGSNSMKAHVTIKETSSEFSRGATFVLHEIMYMYSGTPI